MCQVVLKNPEDMAGFILYNHLFSQQNYRFTINDLVIELKQNYHLSLNQNEIRKQVSDWVSTGLVRENMKDYSVCDR
jgi:hypothetical protein